MTCVLVAWLLHAYVGDWQPATADSHEPWKSIGLEYIPAPVLNGFQQPYLDESYSLVREDKKLKTMFRPGHVGLALLLLGMILPITVAAGGIVILAGTDKPRV